MIDLGVQLIRYRTAIYVDGPPNDDLYINYVNEVKLQGGLTLGKNDKLVWWSSQALDRTKFTHTRYQYDVPSGYISISYHVGPKIRSIQPYETPDVSMFGSQIAQSYFSILDGGNA